MLQDHPDPSGLLLGREVSAGHEPGFWNDDLGTHWLPREFNKKDESPDVASEPSPGTGQICDHRRNRCSKSALGLAVNRTIPAAMPAWRGCRDADARALTKFGNVH